MPYPSIRVPAECFLVHRGVRVFHAYRDDAYPERYQFLFNLCADDEDGRYRFDVRDLAGGGDAADRDAADPGAAIRRALDRALDADEGFPNECGPGPLPSAAENQSAPDQPDDWDLLDLLAAVSGRTEPFGADLDERQRAGLVQLAALAGRLGEAQRATLQGWLGG